MMIPEVATHAPVNGGVVGVGNDGPTKTAPPNHGQVTTGSDWNQMPATVQRHQQVV